MAISDSTERHPLVTRALTTAGYLLALAGLIAVSGTGVDAPDEGPIVEASRSAIVVVEPGP